MRSLLLVCSLLTAACGETTRVDRDRVRSANLTQDGITLLLQGNDDFAQIRSLLLQALAANPNNEPAKVFLATAELLLFVKDSLRAPRGTLRSFYTRAGYAEVDPTASIYDFAVERVTEEDGIPTAAPRAGEIVAFVENELLPPLSALIAVLEAVPPSFLYAIDGSAGGRWFPVAGATTELGGHPLGRFPYWLDRGDLLALAAVLNAVRAGLEGLLAIDWNDVDANAFDPADDPNVEALDVIETRYPRLGTLGRPALWRAARDHVELAWADYLQASAHVRGENPAQQQFGILTISPDRFSSPAARQQALLEEQHFRGWAQAIADSFRIDRIHRIATSAKGTPLPPNDQLRLNFFRFWQGIDLRALYLRTFRDPFTGKKQLGVTSLADITPDMVTIGGIVDEWYGAKPLPGDLLEAAYGVRIDGTPVDTKVIDGSFADWAQNAVRVGTTPSATLDPPRPDLGDVWVARDATNLYVFVDRDLSVLPAGAWSAGYRVAVRGLEFGTEVQGGSGGHGASSSDPRYLPVFAHVPGVGIEIAFPLPAVPQSRHVRMLVGFGSDGPNAATESLRNRIWVEVR
jgi:hypothetical protein